MNDSEIFADLEADEKELCAWLEIFNFESMLWLVFVLVLL